MYKVKYREGIRKLQIWEGRVSFKVGRFLGYIVYGSAPNFNFCQAFDSIFFIKSIYLFLVDEKLTPPIYKRWG